MQGMDLDSNSYTDKLDISVSGTTPTGGYLNYENSILKDGCLTMDEYKVTIENGEVTTTEKGSCESVSLTACDSPNFKPSPEEWFTFDASTNTITGFSDTWDGTTDITIPCQIGGVDVVNMGTGAFSGMNKRLTSVIISDSIETINIGAFAGNGLSVVVIGNGVTTIGNGSFSTNMIQFLKLGNSLEKILDGSFAGNSLTELVIPNSVTEIGNGAFQGNMLKYVELGINVNTIGPTVFLKNSYYNSELSVIYNNTGKEFDWGSIINGTSGYIFETGIVENEYGNVEIKKSN